MQNAWKRKPYNVMAGEPEGRGPLAKKKIDVNGRLILK
jgi:hypothetical protein